MKLYAALIAALVFAALGLWGQQQHLAAVKAQANLKTAIAQRDSVVVALREVQADSARKDAINLAKQQQINKLTVQAAKTQQALNEALKANRAWADARVPDGVWDAIDPDHDEAAARSLVDGTSPGPATPR